jgi:misacylated tRNA(Ala) deacylase
MGATITLVDGTLVALDQVVFYVQSGRQPAAHGTLVWADAQTRVSDARHKGNVLYHPIEGSIPPEGTRVHSLLDWEGRSALMRTHTALHILWGVIWRDYQAHVTSSAMEPGSARQDFELEHLTMDFVTEVEQRITSEVEAEREVHIRFLPHAQAFSIPDLIRTRVNLLPEGIELVRICEHVARTGEVGSIRLRGHESKGRTNKRLRLAIEGSWSSRRGLGSEHPLSALRRSKERRRLRTGIAI